MDRPPNPPAPSASDPPRVRAVDLDLGRLATPPDAIRWDLGERSGSPQAGERLCVVRLGDRSWALEGRYAVGIQQVESPTPIPLTPAYLIGLAHVRGALMPVIDIGSFCSEAPRRQGSGEATPCDALVVDADGMRLCLVVDEILAFEPAAQVTEGTLERPELPTGWLKGSATLAEHGEVSILDLPRIIETLRLRAERRPFDSAGPAP